VAGLKGSLAQLGSWLGGAKRSTERRGELRLPAHGDVTLLWTGEQDQTEQALVALVGISASGVSVRSNVALEVGREVSVTNGRKICRGVIRHCTPDDDAFAVGIETEMVEDLPEEDADRYPAADAEIAIDRVVE
jgi:hypothetical protein